MDDAHTPKPTIYTDPAGIKHLDFKVISSDLDDLLTALESKLEREAAGAEFLALSYFVPCAKVVWDTWKTIQYFCADTPADLSRKREFALSAAPLNRSILDMIFNVVFVLEDVEVRFPWFAKAGWREQKLEDQRLREDFSRHLRRCNWRLTPCRARCFPARAPPATISTEGA